MVLDDPRVGGVVGVSTVAGARFLDGLRLPRTQGEAVGESAVERVVVLFGEEADANHDGPLPDIRDGDVGTPPIYPPSRPERNDVNGERQLARGETRPGDEEKGDDLQPRPRPTPLPIWRFLAAQLGMGDCRATGE